MKKILTLLLTTFLLCSCNTVITDNTATANEANNISFNADELDNSYSLNGSTVISLTDEDIKITKGGTYILEGEMNNASIIVEASKDDSVNLVLNNVTINSGDFASIYIIEAGEAVITLADNSVNSLSDNSSYTQIDSNSVDALIFSKADLTIGGNGTLNLSSAYNHGVVSKDDLIIASGTYNIDVAGQALSGKDCVKIADGVFSLTSGKDSIKSDNDEDADRGYVYIENGTFVISSGADAIYGYRLVDIEGGTFDITTNTSSSADSYKAIKSDLSIVIGNGDITINSADDAIHSNGDILIEDGNFNIVCSDDAIHADGKATINSGNFTISAHEGIEATYIVINDGNIDITASDDGVNATTKSANYTTLFEMNGGYLKVDMGQGDTDAIDSNGSIVINGGTIEITAQSAFDYDQNGEYNGGTIIVNGEEINELTNQMMGGGMFQGGFNQNGGNMQRPNGDQAYSSGMPEGMPGGFSPGQNEFNEENRPDEGRKNGGFRNR